MVSLLGRLGSVDSADRGEQALGMVRKARERQRPYDLVCVDVGRSTATGPELVRRIRSAAAGREVKVVMVTAGRRVAQEADAVLRKPYTQFDLDEALMRAGVLHPA